MNWFFLTLLSVFIVSLANILQKVLMKDDKSDPVSYAIFYAFLLGILNSLFALWYGFQLPPLSVNLVFFFVAALLWGVGMIFHFKALQLLESSEVTILTSVRALVTILASIIFLKEVFNIQKLLGTIIIFISIFLVANLRKGIKFNKGIIYSFGMALFYGLAVVIDAFNLRHIDPISALVIGNFLIGFILLLLYPKALGKWRNFLKPGFLKIMLPLGILSTTQAIAFYFALASGQASQIAPISQAQVVITVLLAVILLKEKDNLLRKLLAAILVTLGVILLR